MFLQARVSKFMRKLTALAGLGMGTAMGGNCCSRAVEKLDAGTPPINKSARHLSYFDENPAAAAAPSSDLS